MLCLPTGTIVTPRRKEKDYTPLSNNALRKHLAREFAVAVFAGAWGSKFVCFDVDDGRAETVRELIDCLEAFGFPRERIYVSFSGNKGYHVEVFFDELVATETLQWMYRLIIGKGELDSRKVEFRPTNTMSIKLPLSIHARTGNVCWYVDRETLVPIERAEYILEIEPVPASMLSELMDANVPDDIPREGAERSPNPVCCGKSSDETRNLGTTLTEEGVRHNMMRNIAVYTRCQGVAREQCRRDLMAWYERQDKCFIRSTREQVLADIDELVTWVYSDHFQVNYALPKGEILLDETNARFILSQRSRSARRIVFFLLARCKALQFKINYASIAKAIYVSERTTIKTILRLEREGVLEIRRGNRYSLGAGEFAAESNSYGVPHERGGKHERQHKIRIRDLMKDATGCYYEALLALLPAHEVERMLLREELEEYAVYRTRLLDDKEYAENGS